MAIQVLGPLTVDGNGALSPRDRVVLSALVVRLGQTCSSEELADALWGDEPPASWNKVVPGCINRLRKALGPASIATSPHGYRLSVPDDDVDVRRFERLVAKGHQLLALTEPDRAILAFREALALWRGPALRDVEEWPPAQSEVQRLEELRLETEEAVLDASLRLGLQAGILAEARSRVAQAPVRERRWALLALAQYLSGGQADALATLRRAREMLSRELGLDPGPELVELEQAMLRQDPALTAASALPKPIAHCPYPGLLPYDVSDADFFFGRQADLAACRSRLEEQGVLVLVGPSGSGKSSLLRAGLVATLARDGVGCVLPPSGSSEADLLTEITTGDRRTVLVLDQFEEIVAQSPSPAQRTRLAEALLAATESRQLVLAIRADRFGDLVDLPGLAPLAERGLLLLGAMDTDALQETIEGPAREAALLLEPGLVELLLSDVRDDPAALPLLSHALRETWERREARTLTVEGYRASGGIRGAVARSADQVYEQLSEQDRARLRDLMLRLLTLAPDGDLLRAAVSRDAIPSDPAHQSLVELLVRARLVTADAEVIGLAHETLARAWPRLRGWLDDDLAGQRILRHLSTSAESWHALGRPDEELYRGDRLARALEWRGSSGAVLTQTESAFLDRSASVAEEQAAAETRALQARRRTRRRARVLVAVVTALAVVAGVSGWLALRERDQAATERDAAAAERLIASARRAATLSQGATDIGLALLLAAEAVQRHDSPETRASLLAALTRSPALVASIRGGGGVGIDLSPDGRWLVVGGDASGRILDADTLEQADAAPEDWIAPAGPGRGFLRFTDEGMDEADLAGRTLARLLMPRLGENWQFQGIEYSHDRSRLVASLESESPTGDRFQSMLVVWDTDGPPRPPRLIGPHEAIWHTAVSPDGSRVFTVSKEGRMSAFDISTGRRVASVALPLDAADKSEQRTIAVSPDGLLVAVSDETDVVVHDAATLRERSRLSGHTGRVLSITFSGDGRQVAAGASDGNVLLWHRLSGTLLERLTGPPAAFVDLALSPDGRTLYAASQENVVLVWDLAGNRRFVPRITGPVDDGLGPLVVVSPDGGSAAYFQPTPTTLGRDSRFQILRTPSGRLHSQPSAYANWGGYSPDGALLAVTAGSRVEIHDTAHLKLTRHAQVTGLANGEAATFAADGELVVVGDRDGTVMALSADALQPVGTPAAIGTELNDVLPIPGSDLVVVLLVDGSYAVVDPVGGEVLSTLAGADETTYGAVSPDGERLAVTGFPGWVGLIDLDTGEWLSEPRSGHGDFGSRVSFNGDGSQFATSGPDGRVILWDGVTGERLATILPSGPGVDLGLTFLLDGHTIQVASAGGEVFRWDTDVDSWLAFACRAAGRNLSQQEWTEAFGEEDYRRTCATHPAGE